MNYLMLEDGYEFINKTILELKDCKNVTIVYRDRIFQSRMLNKAVKIILSPRIEKYIKMPFQHAIYNKIFKNIHNNPEECIVVSAFWVSKSLMDFLKDNYPNTKKVIFFRDTVKLYSELIPSFSIKNINELFDLKYTYNPSDAEAYRFNYMPMYVSKIESRYIPQKKNSDLVFIGVAKDRTEMINSIFEKAKEHGIKCNFKISGVNRKDKICSDGMHYMDRNLDYFDYLGEECSSNCILEIIKGDSQGNTYRALEAVYYNKKLITNWKGIKEFKYYNEKYMKYFELPEEIDYEFIRRKEAVDYGYEGENSPLRLLDQIEDMLKDT